MDVDPYFKAYTSNRHWLDVAEAVLGELRTSTGVDVTAILTGQEVK